MGLFQTLNRLGVLAVGRRPEWASQSIIEGAPSSSGAGVALSGAVKTMVSIALRDQAHLHTAWVTIGEDDIAGTTYRVTVDGNNVDTTGDTDQATTLAAMAADINADVAAGAVVTAAVEDGELVLRGKGEDVYTVAVSIEAGNGEMSETADATTAAARVWLLSGGTGDMPGVWVLANEGVLEGLDRRGLVERLSVAGCARCYVEVFDADGKVSVAVGPGVME